MSQQTRTTPSPTESFQHQSRSACHCPIHADAEPFTAPLGLRFADHVTGDPIQRETPTPPTVSSSLVLERLQQVLEHMELREQDEHPDDAEQLSRTPVNQRHLGQFTDV